MSTCLSTPSGSRAISLPGGMRGASRRICISCVQSGVTVTPTFFVNNVRLRGRFDVESLLVPIERAVRSYPLAR